MLMPTCMSRRSASRDLPSTQKAGGESIATTAGRSRDSAASRSSADCLSRGASTMRPDSSRTTTSRRRLTETSTPTAINEMPPTGNLGSTALVVGRAEMAVIRHRRLCLALVKVVQVDSSHGIRSCFGHTHPVFNHDALEQLLLKRLSQLLVAGFKYLLGCLINLSTICTALAIAGT